MSVSTHEPVSPRKPQLPPGWKVHLSKTYPDRIYYFNEFTGDTSWDCPELITPSPTAVSHKSPLTRPSPIKSNTKNSAENTETKAQPVTIKSPRKQTIKSSTTCKDSKNEPNPIASKTDNNTAIKVVQSKRNPTQQTGKIIATIKLPSRTAVVAPVRQRIPISYKTEVTPDKETKGNPTHCVSSVGSSSTSKKKISLKRTSPATDPTVCRKRLKTITPPQNSKRDSMRIQDHPSSVVEDSRTPNLKKSEFSRDKVLGNRSTPGNTASCKINNESAVHAADVEMLDVSADLTTTLELDVFSQPEPMVVDDPNSFYIVTDTNVLIHNLKLIDELKDTPLEGCGPPHIYIPWIVVQELDGLKKNSKSGTSRNAMEATRFLFSMLKSKHPRFHGQSPEEAASCSSEYSKCSDDRILQCCLSLADIISFDKVILLTNDENLRLKCAIKEVMVHNSQTLMKAFKADVRIKEPRSNTATDKSCAITRRLTYSGSNVAVTVRPGNSRQNACKLRKLVQKNRKKLTILMEAEKNTNMAVDNIICEAKGLMKSFLEPFYLRQMTSAFEDTWKRFSNAIHPPYVLLEILESIEKYWKTVFGLVLPHKLIENFKFLQENFKYTKGFLSNEKEALSVLSSIVTIAMAVQTRYPDINVPTSELEELTSECEELCRKHTIIDSKICDTLSPSVIPVFDFIWTLINRLCGMVMDFYKIPHSFNYNKPDVQPPQEDFCVLITNLYPSVYLVKRHMGSIFDSPNDDAFRHLHKSLLDFVSSLRIKETQLPSCPDFTKEALKAFCMNPQSRERLENGYKQLCHFYDKLSQAIEVMTSTK